IHETLEVILNRSNRAKPHMLLDFAQGGGHLLAFQKLADKLKNLLLRFHGRNIPYRRTRRKRLYNAAVSTFNEIDVECAECAHEYKGIIWTAVHASEDPVLKDLLLGGEFNILICPGCARPAYQDHFVLYQDTAAELIAYIYPPAQKADEEF